MTPAHAADRQFGCTPRDIHLSGRADVVFVAKRSGNYAYKGATFRHSVWFSEAGRRYRIEAEADWAGPSDMCNYCVVDQGRALATLAGRGWPEGRAKWAAFPAAWVDDDPSLLETFLVRKWEMQAPRLVGTGRLLGLPAQHWRGHRGIGKPRRGIDVWVSADQRFPAVLKFVSAGQTSTINWQITRLDVARPVPGHMFLPLLHPKPGLASLLKSRYWPVGYVILYQALLLLCYVGLAFSLSPSKRSVVRRSPLAVVSGFGMMALFFYCPRLDAYFSQLADTPLSVLLGVLSVATVFVLWRASGGSAKQPLAGKLGLTAPLWIVLAGGVGFLWAHQYQSAFAGSVGLGHWMLPFLPVTLLNVAVFAGPNALLQEYLFRGSLYGWLQRRGWSFPAVNTVQALAFSAYHIPRSVIWFGFGPRLAVDLTIMFLFGLVFGLLRRKYDGLLAPWLVHFAYNASLYYVGAASSYGLLDAIRAL